MPFEPLTGIIMSHRTSSQGLMYQRLILKPSGAVTHSHSPKWVQKRYAWFAAGCLQSRAHGGGRVLTIETADDKVHEGHPTNYDLHPTCIVRLIPACSANPLHTVLRPAHL